MTSFWQMLVSYYYYCLWLLEMMCTIFIERVETEIFITGWLLWLTIAKMILLGNSFRLQGQLVLFHGTRCVWVVHSTQQDPESSL